MPEPNSVHSLSLNAPFQSCREQSNAAAKNGRIDHEIVLIDQAGGHQRMQEHGAAIDQYVPAWLGFQLLTRATTSLSMMVELFHSAVFNVVETTYFGIALICFAKPASSSTLGQTAANPS